MGRKRGRAMLTRQDGGLISGVLHPACGERAFLPLLPTVLARPYPLLKEFVVPSGCARARARHRNADARVVPLSTSQFELAQCGEVERIARQVDRGRQWRGSPAGPAPGPSCCATAIARLRATIGDGRIVISVSYSRTICAQFGVSARGARMDQRDRGFDVIFADLRAVADRSSRRWPSSIRSRSHCDRS